jgi:hypothetical protein
MPDGSDIDHGLRSPSGLDGSACSGGKQRKRYANARTISWGRDERDLTAELIRHQVMDDVKAEPGAPLRVWW